LKQGVNPTRTPFEASADSFVYFGDCRIWLAFQAGIALQSSHKPQLSGKSLRFSGLKFLLQQKPMGSGLNTWRILFRRKHVFEKIFV